MSSYDDLLQGFSSDDKKKDRLASSLSEAAVTNPDEFANMVRLSKAASISIESIPDYKNEAEQAKYLGEVGFSRLWKDAPKTSEFLSDPTNAKLARNDVPAMGFLERKIRSLGDGVVGLGGSALSGTGYTLDAMQRRILMGAASFLPKPMAGGEVTDESIVGQTMGDDWRYVAAPLKDASKSISVPKDQRDFGDDVMQAIGQIGGQFALGPLNLPTMFAQGVDMQAERSIKDNASQANKDWSMLGSGAWTMITEKVLGIDRWAKMGPLTSIKNPVGARVGGVGLAAASEGVQETLENVGQDALRKGLTNENADIGFGDAAYAGGVGATAAGVVRSFIESALHIKARRTQEFFTDLGDAAKQSELINRAPDKMSEFVAQAAQGGPVENVFIPSDQFVRYFQEVGADPVEAAQAMGVTNYTEAIAAGTDVIIPLGDFAAKVAPSEHLQGLMPDLRLHQGDATARELMEMEADRDTREAYLKQQLESLIAEGETSRVLNLAIDRITQDVEGQLLGAGVEPSTARTQAQVMRGVAVLAQRAFPNEEPLAAAEKLWGQYGLTVSRELPPILTKLKNADVQLDPLLDRLRAAAMPSQTEVFGQPLHEFLRAMGGVKDQGGELSARDADVGNAPFVKNLIQAAGLDLDGAREIAAQQGFPVGESEADFISALTASFEGNPVYSPNQENPQALDLLQTLESLDKALKDSGVDLNAVDNATARKMLEQAGKVSASVGSDVLYQSQDKKRGFLQIGANRQMQIGLTENSNLSTFLHETGHFYLEVMGDLAGNADAAQQVKDDYAAILKWMGVTDRSQIKTEQHEQFARANEAYLREGKAPSPELQGAFQRFKAWLSYLYRNLASMNVTLNDEVRAVFDRIYATDAEIDAASDKVDVAPMFLTAELMGMSPEEFALYRERVGKVSADAQDKLLTKLMREYERGRKEWWKEERANVREEVAAEVDAQPVYRAFAALVAGEYNGQPFKLNKADLVARFGEPYLKTLPRGFQRIYAGDGGIDVEMAAEVFGYATGDDLIKALVEMRNRNELIEAEADARMKERHGDMLTDGTAAVAAVEALHNDERANVLAVELRALNRLANAMEPARKLERQKAADEQRARVAATETPNLSWFKSAAQGRLEQMVLRDINPNSYLIAGRRAAREAFAALARNDHQTAAAAKQRELLNHYLYMESVKAKADLDKIDQRFKKMLTGSDEKTAKSRDLDLVMAARAILADFGYGGKAKKAAAYLEKVKDYDPATHAVLMQSVEAADELAASLPPNSKGPALRDLTTLQLRALADEVEALWFLAKRNRTMEIDGNLIDLQDIDDQLLSRLKDIGIPFRVAGEGYAITEGEMKIKDIRTFIASARRVEHWVDAIDGKEGENKIGLFRKYVWSPISDAAVAYRADKAKFLRKFRESFKSIEETLKPKIIAADELGYVFGKDSGGSAMNEILHAILHTGNESNKRKLLLGRNWATLREDGSLDTSRWDSFVSRMISEGNITKAHYDFAQSIWDLLESMKPMAQKTHREVFGKYFDEVTAQEFVTPFGIYRGGYVPAMADSRIVSDAAMRDLQEQENQAMSFAFPTTSKGFTKARTEYNRPLMLDMRSLAQHIDKVLMFSRMEIPVRDVRKALGKEAGQALARIDPTIIGGMITPWLNRAAKQQVETPISGAGRLMRFFSVIRSRAGAAAMFGNLVNTAQQITGFSLAALKVKPSLMLSSTADYMKHPGKFTKAVSEASPYMATRMENEVAAMSGEINDILLNPSLLENGQNWAMKHAYFMQSAVDNVMSPIIWTAAYNQAIEGGNDHKDAVRLADAAVRQTQGSTQPEDISRIEGGNAFVRMFTQFAGYFNMQANLLGAQFITLSRDYGLMNSKGRAFFIFTAGFLIPAMMSEVIVQAFRGGPDDEDKDGEYLDDWLSALFMGSVRTATAMVPVVGQGVMSVINASNSKPYDDRLATPPAISMLESAARAPFSATKAINGEGSNQKAVRDVATLVSMTLGIPVNVAAKPIGYASGVSDGRISPTSNADMVRGSITGVASADSKR